MVVRVVLEGVRTPVGGVRGIFSETMRWAVLG